MNPSPSSPRTTSPRSPRAERSGISQPVPSQSPRSTSPYHRNSPRGASPFVKRNNRPPIPTSVSKRPGTASPRAETPRAEETTTSTPPVTTHSKPGPRGMALPLGGIESLDQARDMLKVLGAQVDEARADKSAIWEQTRADARSMAQVAKNIEGNQGALSKVVSSLEAQLVEVRKEKEAAIEATRSDRKLWERQLREQACSSFPSAASRSFPHTTAVACPRFCSGRALPHSRAVQKVFGASRPRPESVLTVVCVGSRACPRAGAAAERGRATAGPGAASCQRGEQRAAAGAGDARDSEARG